jgi:hypothetical protein
LFLVPFFQRCHLGIHYFCLFLATAFSKTTCWFLSFQEMPLSFLFLATAFSRTT